MSEWVESRSLIARIFLSEILSLAQGILKLIDLVVFYVAIDRNV